MDDLPALDATDLTLLAALQEDGAMRNVELASRVGLAPSSCLERVRRLRRLGVLRGVHAEVEPSALGIGLRAFVRVQIRRHGRKEVEGFQEHALSLSEVVAVHHLTGEDDFLLEVAVRDPAHLRDLAVDGFATRPEVGRIQTSLLFSSVRKPSLPCWREPNRGGVRKNA